MDIKQQIEQDLKAAMLAKKSAKVTTLRGLKGTILNAEIATGKRDVGLSDEEIITLFQKEAKKRQESADLYTQGGNADRAQAELAEKVIIEAYLPAQLSDEELQSVVEQVVAELGASDMSAMGLVISAVKQRVAGAADGAAIARLVKERLSQ